MKPERRLPIVWRGGLSRIKVAAVGLLILAVFGFGAQAGDARKQSKEPTRSVYLVKYYVDGEVRYAKKPVGKVVTISVLAYRNSGTYVCTPSGFGRKARCYKRTK